MRAVWSFRRRIVAYRPARGASSDDAGVSFTVLAWLSLDGLAGAETDPGHDPGQMCEGSTSRLCAEHFRKGSRIGVRDWNAGAFQLESLILAQNERWRQA